MWATNPAASIVESAASSSATARSGAPSSTQTSEWKQLSQSHSQGYTSVLGAV